MDWLRSWSTWRATGREATRPAGLAAAAAGAGSSAGARLRSRGRGASHSANTAPVTLAGPGATSPPSGGFRSLSGPARVAARSSVPIFSRQAFRAGGRTRCPGEWNRLGTRWCWPGSSVKARRARRGQRPSPHRFLGFLCGLSHNRSTGRPPAYPQLFREAVIFSIRTRAWRARWGSATGCLR